MKSRPDNPVPDLRRFKQAQESAHGGFADALRELRAGRKTSHWIWYVFPQLAGLGQSPTAVHYGIAGPDEAAAYLRDPVLAERLVAASAAVRAHVAPARGVPLRLEELMGSSIDAIKLVSCMTLFGHMAQRERDHANEPRPELDALVEHAHAILVAAAEQGYSPCPFTLAELGSSP